MEIERDLRRVPEEDLDFEGQLSVSRAYDAPNPFLTIDGLGSSACHSAPFGKGERTIIDTDVRDTWEMYASKIQFRNPAWSVFVQGVVRNVCEGLGVNFDASRPHAELYKLLLYETGSHFLPHVDTEKADGMFASLIIILPSEFTGGDVHTSHGGVNTVFNSSQNSLKQTTALAWYTDVTRSETHQERVPICHLIQPLAYDRIAPSRSPASDTDPYPNKRRRKKKKWGFDSGDDSDEEDFNASKASKLQSGYLESSTVSVENFVDPDGNKMRGSLQMDKSLENQLETHGNVSSEYEGYMGNYLRGDARPVLSQLCPRHMAALVEHWRRLLYRRRRLRSISHPIPEHLIDSDYLCDSIKYMTKENHQDAAFKLLLDIAVSQLDAVLWRKAVGARYSGNNRLDGLQWTCCRARARDLWFGTLASLLRPIIRDSNSNAPLTFIENTSDLAEDHSDAMEIDAFVLEMRKEILDNLPVFTSSAELRMFTQAIQAEGESTWFGIGSSRKYATKLPL
ncbi:Protein kinase domain-containing protein [Mycena kentingensis (nom. inval.)]|nr:Protein kinase domain-containing protein [Mycena kentingensis (nom. inval.)]